MPCAFLQARCDVRHNHNIRKEIPKRKVLDPAIHPPAFAWVAALGFARQKRNPPMGNGGVFLLPLGPFLRASTSRCGWGFSIGRCRIVRPVGRLYLSGSPLPGTQRVTGHGKKRKMFTGQSEAPVFLTLFPACTRNILSKDQKSCTSPAQIY